VQDGSVWQGALLAAVHAEWLTLGRASIRSELEAGAALAVAESGESAVARTARGAHAGGVTSVRLTSPLSRHRFLESELGFGLAASLTAQAYHVDVISLSGLFLQTSLGLGWSERAP
jgi:hypothetical protein